MRQERLEDVVVGAKPALLGWPRVRHPLRVTLHVCVLTVAKLLPMRLKNRVLRALGVSVGKDAAIALGVMFDIFHPDRISIGARSTIGYGTTILTHEATQDRFSIGPVVIGDDVLIGANCTVLPGVAIGDGATVSAHSLVNEDVPAGAFYGGVPARDLSD